MGTEWTGLAVMEGIGTEGIGSDRKSCSGRERIGTYRRGQEWNGSERTERGF